MAAEPRGSGQQAAHAEYARFTLTLDRVRKDDEIYAHGMWVTVLDDPGPGTDRSGRPAVLVHGRRPDTGAAGVMAYQPDEEIAVRRARGSTHLQHLKVTSPDGTLTYHAVHDQDTADRVTDAARSTAGTAVTAGQPGAADLPNSARDLLAHAAANGWDTEWAAGPGPGTGKLTAVHPDHDYLQTAQEWRNGRKIARSDSEEYGPLSESRGLISGSPGRLPGQTRGEIAAEKISGSSNHIMTAVYMDDGDLAAAGGELIRRLPLVADPDAVRERLQGVRNEITVRAAKDSPVRERVAPHAAACRQLAADIRTAFPDGKRMADSTSAVSHPEMLDGAGTLDEAARHFGAQREREGISALYKASRDLSTRAGLMRQPDYGTRASAAGHAAAKEFAARAGNLHRTAADQVPLTDADGRQLRPGDTVELLAGPAAGQRTVVTRWHTRTASATSPDKIRLVSRADGSEPETAVPGTQPVSDDPADEARDLAARLRGTGQDAPAGGRSATASARLEEAAVLFDAGEQAAGRRVAANVSRAMHQYATWGGINRNYAARVLALASGPPGEEPGSPADAARQLATSLLASPHVAAPGDAGTLLDRAAGHFDAGRDLLGTEALEAAAGRLAVRAAEWDAAATSREDQARQPVSAAVSRHAAEDTARARAAARELGRMAGDARAILAGAPPARTGPQRIRTASSASHSEWHRVRDDAAHRAVLENSAREGTAVTYDEDPPLSQAPKGARDLHAQAVASGWDVSYHRATLQNGIPVLRVTAVNPDLQMEVSHAWQDTRKDAAEGTLTASLKEIAGHPRREHTPATAQAHPRQAPEPVQQGETQASRRVPQRTRRAASAVPTRGRGRTTG